MEYTIHEKLHKKTLPQLLLEEDIHIAMLQETFLTQDDKIYIKGYRIFRSNGQTHRKGVAILIAENLICDKYITYKDNQGRFIKIKLKTPEDKHITISNIYIEPDMKNHPEIIPEEILEGDIIGGDLNKMEINMDKDGVYQTKNIGNNKKRIQQPKGTSDHYILIYEKILPIEVEKNEKTKIIQDKNIIENNWNNITNFLTQKCREIIIKDPNKKIKINTKGLKNNNINYYENFEELKRNNQEKFKEEQKKHALQLGMILRNDYISATAYDKLASIMQIKSKNIYWNSQDEQMRQDIIEGFRNLYKDDKKINCQTQTIIHKMIETLNIIKQQIQLDQIDPPHIPRSRAKDQYGFGQRKIIKLIRGESMKETINKLQWLLSETQNSENIQLLIHNISKIILKKKNLKLNLLET